MEKNLESEFQGHQCDCTSFLFMQTFCLLFLDFFLKSSTNEYWLVVNASV